MEKEVLVSIFVPVYNGEKYLSETLFSIQKQTYSNFEVLLVDDSSTDNSVSILKNFVEKDTRFKLFTKENGGMVPKSMNFVKPHIKGEFFFYASQDDLFSQDLIEKMLQRQKETNADTVLPDMEFYYEKRTNNRKIIGLNGKRDAVLTGKEALIESLEWNIHGFALFRSELLKNEFFPEDAFDSDEYVTRKMFLQSNKVAFSTGTFFYRQDNEKAITRQFSKKDFFRLNTFYKIYVLLNNNLDKKYVLRSQQSLLKEYLRLKEKYKSAEFKTKEDKEEIRLFLNDFKKEHFTNSFFIKAFSKALFGMKLKIFMSLVLLKLKMNCSN